MADLTRTLTDPNVPIHISQGTVDTSAAQAIEFLGGVAKQIGGAMAVNKLTGGAQNLDDVEPDPSLVNDPLGAGPVQDPGLEVVRQISGLNNLSQVAAARKAGSISGSQASARAKALLKRTLADSGGMFNDEIRKAFGGFFGSAVDGGGFFKDIEREDPAEKGRQEAVREMSKQAALLGVPFDTYAEAATQQGRLQFELDALKRKQSLTSADISNKNSMSFSAASTAIINEVFTDMKTSGPLDNRKITQYKNKVSLLSANLEREWRDDLAKQGRSPSEDEVKAFRDRRKDFMESMLGENGILTNNSLREQASNELETVMKMYKLTGVKAFPKFAVINEVLPGQAEFVVNLLTSPNYASLIDKNPAMKQFKDFMEDGDTSAFAKKALDYLTASTPGDDDLGAKAAGALLANDSIVPKLPTDKLVDMIKNTPDGIRSLKSNSFKASIVKGEKTVGDVESSMKAALKALQATHTAEKGVILTGLDISYTPDSNIPYHPLTGAIDFLSGLGLSKGLDPTEYQKLEIRDQSGRLVSNDFYSAILNSIDVAKSYPELWEGTYENPQEYVKSLVTGKPIDKKQEGGKAAGAGAAALGETKVDMGEQDAQVDESPIGDTQVDRGFLRKVEGFITKANVPLPDKSQSGVTVGSGVDLGQMSVKDLNNLNLPASLYKKVAPYLGLKKQKAVEALKKTPLELTKDEAELLTQKVKDREITVVQKKYDKAVRKGAPKFKDLHPNQQTVIASVAYQFGDLPTKTPSFWRYVTDQDWEGAIQELRDFNNGKPDLYSDRRGQEADLLEASMSQTKETFAGSRRELEIQSLMKEYPEFTREEIEAIINGA